MNHVIFLGWESPDIKGQARIIHDDSWRPIDKWKDSIMFRNAEFHDQGTGVNRMSWMFSSVAESHFVCLSVPKYSETCSFFWWCSSRRVLTVMFINLPYHSNHDPDMSRWSNVSFSNYITAGFAVGVCQLGLPCYAGTNAFVHCEIWFPKEATQIKDRQLFPQLWFCLRIIFSPEIWWFERLKLGDGRVGCGLLSHGRQSRRRHHPGGVLSSSTPRRWGRFRGWPKSSSISARGGLVSFTKSWGKSDIWWCIL